jgi:nucleoside-diphosphate-sugar epimerase
MTTKMKIILPGGAGLVGQNLIIRLKAKGYVNIIVLDKHRTNLEILKKTHPDIVTEYADLAEVGEWQRHFIDSDAVVMLQAQIGGNDYNDFMRNNINSTQLILNEIKKNSTPYLVHISSSVVESVADDFYTNTKKEQENMISDSDITSIILRPTLMFGWFDRKHLGWLSRFMKKVPVFPIPGHGRYMRQPLYVGDFSNIIISCIENRFQDGIYNISGLEHVEYIDIIRKIKESINIKTAIINIPYKIFYFLLWLWSLFDYNPPFTTQQLSALVQNEEFEVIDWPSIFNVSSTPFAAAVDETFNDQTYSDIVLEF